MRFMTEKEKEVILAAFVGLDDLLKQYREAVLWLTLGDHTSSSRLTVQATRQRMQELQEKITTLLADIASKTQTN
jgi:hypothetical protein